MKVADPNMPDYKDSLDIAVIGMSGRFPGARNVEEFWRNLRDGVESVTRFSDQDLLDAGVDPAMLTDPNYVKAGAILEDIEMFDASFFGLTPREAQIIDPQHRLFLEEAWTVIERAGYDPDTYGGTIGVFAGAGISTYLLNNLLPNPNLLQSIGQLSVVLGNDKDSLTTRTAYLLNLTGPCYTLQAYCSTSLVAVCTACEALIGGQCDIALAGGVLVAVPQRAGYYYQEGGISSPDARCRAFDAKAKGAPFGNGVAVVLLKRLADAVADGDTIHAVVKGWAVNNDGALKVGYTAPGVRGQSRVISQALANAEVNAESISYIEAHGTGTALGDAVEFQALVRAFGEHTDKKGYCAIGSVKTNIGHTDRAAGVTGLIKTVLSLEHRLIPPSLNYDEPNPNIDFSDTPFYVNTELREWKTLDGRPRHAGVSSFGIGGTNAHVILEEAPDIPYGEPLRSHQVLLLSAKTPTALETATDNLCAHLRQNPDINMADLAYTLQVGRRAFEQRRILVCEGCTDALEALAAHDPTRLVDHVQPTRERPLAFMFSGVGDHYVNMGRELYQTEPVFRQAMDKCCDILQPILGLDLRNVLYPEKASVTASRQNIDLRQMLGRNGATHPIIDDALSQAQIAQPAIFAIEYALVQLLESWGIVPDALIGYSLGEYVAACISGVLSVEDALALVTRRAQMIQRLPPGSMVAVPLSEEEVQPLLNDQICLAVVNGPGTCVLAGATEAIEQLERRLAESEIAFRRLGTSHAVHSTMMEPIAVELTALAQTMPLSPPQIPYLSNVTGRWITDEEATDPAYWARHLCQTVRFGDGLARLLQDRERVLLEVGPGQSLGSFVKQHPACAREQWSQVLPTLHSAYEQQSDTAFILGTLGRLWLTGLRIDWQGYYAGEHRRRIPLPTYPFQRERYWIDSSQGASTSPKEKTKKKTDIADWFYKPVWEVSPVPGAKSETAETWLIFEDSLGWGALLAQRLSRPDLSAVRVQAGETFARVEDNLFTVRPDEPADYLALLEALRQSNLVPTQIVHLCSITGPEKEQERVESFREAQRVGFYSLLCLTQAIGAQSSIEALQITIVSNEAQPVEDEPTRPEKATVLGLSRVIPQEYPNIRCRSVDIALPIEASGQEGALLDQLTAELTCPTTDTVVAYRAGTRYVQKFEPKRLPDEAATQRLRPGGVYLITGGLGSVGLVLAQYLAQRVQAKLVLLGRSGLPARDEWANWLTGSDNESPTSQRIRAVQALEEMGAEVLVKAADVADEEQMQAAIESIYERFGALNGVIHAAGQMNPSGFQLVQTMDHATCESHFRPKAYGLYVLDQVLRGKELDFCVLFSSLSSVLGGLMFGAYAAANAFVDAYVYAHNRTGEAWISVNWDVWGVSKAQESMQALGATVTEFTMTPEEGVCAFARALTSDETRLVHSTGDLDTRVRQWVMLDALATRPVASLETVSRPELATAYVPANNEFERRLAGIWQSVLGIGQIGIHDNFFDLGGNSLIGLQLVSKIQKELGVQVPATALFEAPTVNALAKYLQPESTIEEDTIEADLVERRRQARQCVGSQGIAIIGMTGRFPGASNVELFWENLCNGIESLTFFTDEEVLEAGAPADLLNDPYYVKARPILENVELFDAAFFGYSPREAELMDPQHRLFLECACEALELAGYDPEKYKGLIGVFAGTNISSYMLGMSGTGSARLMELEDPYQGIVGNDKDSLTTTASYKLNLRGPSVAVQTFCSTSLVATHMACQSLLNGECDIALSGGVSIRIPQKMGYQYHPGGMESPDGHCRAFDARAQGTTFGDGVGIVVLKRLEDALKDGDTITAVIKGSAMNNDGSLKVGYTAPSVVGQLEVVATALENAGIDPETIGYIEAHGTATELGDPIEVTSLTRAFRKHTDKKGYCAIGSVKTNVGHLDRAAGVSGLIKAALAVKHGLIPPSLHFESPNPGIDFDNSPFYVNTSLSEWPRRNGMPRRAGVNSLGMGGTNVHVIVEEPSAILPSGSVKPWQLLVLSARSEPALDTATANLARYLREHPDTNLADVAYTLQVGRRTFEHRRVLVCQNAEDAWQALEAGDTRRVLTLYQRPVNRLIAFMFPGVGDHYLQMARELYETESVFRDTVERCCKVLYPYLGTKLHDLLYPEHPAQPQTGEDKVDLRAMLRRGDQDKSPAAKHLDETAIAQPVVFAIEYALAHLLMSWGMRPHALVGYSLGEYVAACIAGVLSLEDALKLVAERARMIQSLPSGNMLAVSLSEEEVQPLLSEEISLAIHNGETTCVLAGSPEAISRLEAELTAQEIACRRLDTTHAFHSHMMAPLAEQLTEITRKIRLNPPRIPYLSNVTGTWITDEQATDPGYWARHMCQPVRFFEALSTMLESEERVLLEVGPGQALGSFAKQHPACTPGQMALILPTMRYEYDRQSDLGFLLGTLGKLWMVGCEPKWAGFYAGEPRRRLPLPTYPFQRQRYWIESGNGRAPGQAASKVAETGATSLERKPLDDWFYLPIWNQTAPHLPSLSAPLPESEPACWLLFVDECGLGVQVAEWLTARGQQVVTVRPGDSFERSEEKGQYIVRPHAREDYADLLRTLQQQQLKPTQIVHLWSVTSDESISSGRDFLDLALSRGFYSLMNLAQALGDLDIAACNLSVVTSHVQSLTGGETVCPEKTTIMGPCKVIPQEYPDVPCRSIDVALPAPDAWQREALLDSLLAELTSPISDTVVALRDRRRWVQTFQPLRLPPLDGGKPPLLRHNGVYLLTGGLGGIGMAIAEYLARTVQAKLILVGRSALPPREEWQQIVATAGDESGVGRKIRGVQRLEELGAEVLTIAADVADEGQMRAAVEQAVARFHTIHGVVHAAGVPGVGLIQVKTIDAAASVLAPKVLGTLVLERVLKDVALDFLALFSSEAAFTGGGLGQIDYCAANAFLDGYAQRHAGSQHLVTSINWGEWQWNAWEEGLDGFSPEVQDYFRVNRQKYGIAFEEGSEALGRILSYRLPWVAVSTRDLRPVVEGSSKQSAMRLMLETAQQSPEARPKYPRPALGTSYAAPRNDLERKIAALWGDLLGVAEVGIDDNFFDLGGNSLVGLSLIARLRKELDAKALSAQTLYEAPTVGALAKLLSQDQDERKAVLAERLEHGKMRYQQRVRRQRPSRSSRED
jgi:acyl transferase domain-containing protein/acyl carrier protein